MGHSASYTALKVVYCSWCCLCLILFNDKIRGQHLPRPGDHSQLASRPPPPPPRRRWERRPPRPPQSPDQKRACCTLCMSPTRFTPFHSFTRSALSACPPAPRFCAPLSPSASGPEPAGCGCGCGCGCCEERASRRGPPKCPDAGGRGRGISPQHRQQRLTMMRSGQVVSRLMKPDTDERRRCTAGGVLKDGGR